MTLSTKCLNEELRRVPSHWASFWRYVCGADVRGVMHSCVGMSVSVHTCTCLSPPPPAHAECHNVYSPFNLFVVHG